MQKYLETFFRHRRLLVSCLIGALIVSGAFAMAQPRTYEASAQIWFQANWFQTSSSIGLTNQANNTSSSQATSTAAQSTATPADVAKGVFNELLGSRSFCVAVGQRGPLANYLAQPGHGVPPSDPATALSALYGELRGDGSPAAGSQATGDAIVAQVEKVKVASSGPQLVTLTFDFPDPVVASGTLKAILDEFSSEVLASQRTQAQEQLGYLTQQVADQQKLVAGADADVAHYLAQHAELRSVNPPPDATFSGLQQVADTAHQQYAYLIQQRDQVQFQVNALKQGSTSEFRVIDSPIPPTKPNSLMKTLLSAAAAGLGIGLLLAGAILAALVFADRTLRTADDVERSLGLKVVGSIPLRAVGGSVRRDGKVVRARPSAPSSGAAS
jgi:uncharacterized protein involved in exopolysaccharide biosynthesis